MPAGGWRLICYPGEVNPRSVPWRKTPGRGQVVCDPPRGCSRPLRVSVCFTHPTPPHQHCPWMQWGHGGLRQRLVLPAGLSSWSSPPGRCPPYGDLGERQVSALPSHGHPDESLEHLDVTGVMHQGSESVPAPVREVWSHQVLLLPVSQGGDLTPALTDAHSNVHFAARCCTQP